MSLIWFDKVFTVTYITVLRKDQLWKNGQDIVDDKIKQIYEWDNLHK